MRISRANFFVSPCSGAGSGGSRRKWGDGSNGSSGREWVDCGSGGREGDGNGPAPHLGLTHHILRLWKRMRITCMR